MCCRQTRQALAAFGQHGERQRAEYLGLSKRQRSPAQQTCSISNLQSWTGGRQGRKKSKCGESPKATQPTWLAPERSCARNTATAIASVLLHGCRSYCGSATCQWPWAPANTTTVPRNLRGFSSQRPVAAIGRMELQSTSSGEYGSSRLSRRSTWTQEVRCTS